MVGKRWKTYSLAQKQTSLNICICTANVNETGQKEQSFFNLCKEYKCWRLYKWNIQRIKQRRITKNGDQHSNEKYTTKNVY